MYLSLGMKLVKVHRIVKFKQSDRLKKCIGFSMDKRRNALNWWITAFMVKQWKI